MPRGIRGRKSSEERKPVNAIVPKERDPSDGVWRPLDESDASINPYVSEERPKTAEEVLAERQSQAAQAAEEAAAAREAAAAAATQPMSSKSKRKLEAIAQEKEKEAKRLALYVSLAKHQMKPEQLRLLGSSSVRGGAPTKRQRQEHDEGMRKAMHTESAASSASCEVQAGT
jgi:hypothetical protein